MSTPPPLRWILHLDMDAFFASVEQLDNPALAGKPVIVGGGDRGVVSAASYEARAFGVRSAIPSFQARKLCPQGIFVPHRMWRYVEKSREIMDVLRDFSPLVEPASIDEAYVDLTGLEMVFTEGAVALARRIQAEVMARTSLSCSVGLAPAKFLAKIASDMHKPRGLSVLTHDAVEAFLQTLDVGKIPGVGKHTLVTLHNYGVFTAGDVRRHPRDFWVRKLGKAGEALFDRALGIDNRMVEPEYARKSESAETTFSRDTSDMNELATWLLRHAERVGAGLRREKLLGRTIVLKVKYSDFTQITRSRTLDAPTNATRVIYEEALALLRDLNPQKPLRLIGLGVSQFGERPVQLSLLPEASSASKEKDAALDTVIDGLRNKFGNKAIVRGKLFGGKK